MLKSLKLIKSFIQIPKERKVNRCSACANIAAQKACFDTGDGVIMIEKYCDECAKKVMGPEG